MVVKQKDLDKEQIEAERALNATAVADDVAAASKAGAAGAARAASKGAGAVIEENDFIPDPAMQPRNILFFDNLVSGLTPMVKNLPYDEIIDRPNGMRGYILNLTLAGEGLVRDGDKSFVCRRGDMLLFPPHVPHYYHINLGVDQWFHQWIYFFPRGYWLSALNFTPARSVLPMVANVDSSKVTAVHHVQTSSGTDTYIGRDYVHDTGTGGGSGGSGSKSTNHTLGGGQIGYFKVDEEHFEEFSTLFYEVIKRSLLTSECSQMLATNYLEQILFRRLELSSNPNLDLKYIDPRVTRACMYIKEHLSDQKISIAMVAEQVNLSPSRISHLFEKELGISMIKWRDQERLKLAKTLLATTSLKIDQVAYQVGIMDLAYFFKFFKRHCQVTPTQFRGELKPQQ